MVTHVVRKGVIFVVLSLALGACGAQESGSGHNFKVNLDVTKEATASDVGLPRYPGSMPYTDDGEDSGSGANIGISTPVFGLKVAATKMETRDRPEAVGVFYRKALAKYGQVLECGAGSKGKKKSESASDDDLTCDSDTEGVVYKVGTSKNQRIVAIEPHGTGTRFSLVHVDVRGKSE